MDNVTLLEAKNIFFSYEPGKQILCNLSLKIHAHEKIAIVGANGAGKSTFLLCTNGVLSPKVGELLWNGQKITKKNITLLRKNVGIVFQEADSQIVATTVLSEVSFGPMNLKLPIEEVKRRTYDAMEAMNLSEYSNRGTHYLSGGEKKRVTIADVLAMDPEIFIFDEPSVSLDFYHLQQLERTLQTLWEKGKTILVSTHDSDFAYRFADRVIVFHNGSILADGPPAKIWGQDGMLAAAHLQQPTLFQIQQILLKKGLLKSDTPPRSIEELENLLG